MRSRELSRRTRGRCRSGLLSLALAAALASCSTAPAVDGAATASDDTAAAPTPAGTEGSTTGEGGTAGGGSGTERPTVVGDELDPAAADAVFLTAVDEVVAGTEYQGIVDVDPGGFLLLATTICDLLEEGADVGALLDATAASLGAADATDPSLAALGGGVVGAAVAVYCPTYGDAIEDLGAQG